MVWKRQNESNVKVSQEPAEGEVRANTHEDRATPGTVTPHGGLSTCDLSGVTFSGRLLTPPHMPHLPAVYHQEGTTAAGSEGRPPVLCRRVLTGSLIIAASLRAKNVRTGRPALRGAELWSLLVGGPAERPSYAQGSAVGVGRDVINTQA